MFKTFKTNGVATTIEISEEGKVIYSVGKKKTTFDLSECDSFTYEFDATGEKFEITKDMIAPVKGGVYGTEDIGSKAADDGPEAEANIKNAEEIEPWLWLVISKGEEKLQYNNDHAETRRHYSYSDQNDKYDTLMADEDLFETVFKKIKRKELIEAIKLLEPKQQELVQDIYFRKHLKKDMANKKGISNAAITYQLKVIHENLKKKLKNFSS
jgi:RNA polymerase sigma-70 factor (ECF subfamily)